jgi:hypothetical protein
VCDVKERWNSKALKAKQRAALKANKAKSKEEVVVVEVVTDVVREEEEEEEEVDAIMPDTVERSEIIATLHGLRAHGVVVTFPSKKTSNYYDALGDSTVVECVCENEILGSGSGNNYAAARAECEDDADVLSTLKTLLQSKADLARAAALDGDGAAEYAPVISVIDYANVCFAWGVKKQVTDKETGRLKWIGTFDGQGAKTAVEKLEALGCKHITGFIHRKYGEDPVIRELVNKRLAFLVDFEEGAVENDDVDCIRHALQTGGTVISNDGYADHVTNMDNGLLGFDFTEREGMKKVIRETMNFKKEADNFELLYPLAAVYVPLTRVSWAASLLRSRR